MTIRIYHQCGHCTNWNIESFEQDGCGNGLILSPVHMSSEVLVNKKAKLKQSAFFDPQFYLPSSQKAKLTSYEFFPETISNGFSTADFHAHAADAASKCVVFQRKNKFLSVVIPTRYLDQMYTDYIERQNAYTVLPFIEAVEKQEVGSVFLTVALTDHMIKDAGFRTRILNWATSFPAITGLYLIPACSRETKQIQDPEFLFGLLTLVSEMRKIGLDVLVGYLNTENLLLTTIPEVAITFGAFENTRMFSLDKFVETDEDRRGPRARIYVPGLLNWIHFTQARELRKVLPSLWNKVHNPSLESEEAFAAAAEPTFNQPGLYKHHFKCVQAQVDELSGLSPEKRFVWLSDKVDQAQEAYQHIAKKLDIEKHGSGAHLEAWHVALKRFRASL